MNSRVLRCAALGALATLAITANAAVTTLYSTLGSFQSATGATSATGALPGPSSTSGAGLLGTVTVTAPRWHTFDFVDALPGYEIGVSNGTGNTAVPTIFYNDGIDVTFAGPVFAAGFEFVEPTANGFRNGCNVAVCIDSRYQVELKSGASSVAIFAWTPLKDQLDFWGVWSDTAFDRMEIRETVGTDDNEFYGQFYTGSRAPVAAVPEPSTYALMAAGLGVLGFVARRRRTDVR